MEYMEMKMQEHLEAAEHEFNHLCETLDPPMDWADPDWEKEEKVHNWRNYASEELRWEWGNMTGRQRLIVSAALNDVATNENWD